MRELVRVSSASRKRLGSTPATVRRSRRRRWGVLPSPRSSGSSALIPVATSSTRSGTASSTARGSSAAHMSSIVHAWMGTMWDVAAGWASAQSSVPRQRSISSGARAIAGQRAITRMALSKPARVCDTQRGVSCRCTSWHRGDVHASRMLIVCESSLVANTANVNPQRAGFPSGTWVENSSPTRLVISSSKHEQWLRADVRRG